MAKEITPNVPEWEKQQSCSAEVYGLRWANKAYLCPWLPEEYGGLGLGFEYSVIINEELLRGNAFGLEVPLHSDVATPYIYSYASGELKNVGFQGARRGR